MVFLVTQLVLPVVTPVVVDLVPGSTEVLFDLVGPGLGGWVLLESVQNLLDEGVTYRWRVCVSWFKRDNLVEETKVLLRVIIPATSELEQKILTREVYVSNFIIIY